MTHPLVVWTLPDPVEQELIAVPPDGGGERERVGAGVDDVVDGWRANPVGRLAPTSWTGVPLAYADPEAVKTHGRWVGRGEGVGRLDAASGSDAEGEADDIGGDRGNSPAGPGEGDQAGGALAGVDGPGAEVAGVGNPAASAAAWG